MERQLLRRNVSETLEFSLFRILLTPSNSPLNGFLFVSGFFFLSFPFWLLKRIHWERFHRRTLFSFYHNFKEIVGVGVI